MEQREQLNLVLETAMFFYFKVTGSNSFEECLDSAIEKAWGDATAQGAYNTIIEKGNNETSQKAKNNAEKHLKNKIYIVLDINSEEYDKWHDETCKEIRDRFLKVKNKIKENENAFSYGNAQKWVNMTMKYLYMMAIAFEMSSKEYEEKWNNIKKLEDSFHVPVDSYIIEALWGKEGIKLPYNGEVNEKGLPIYARNQNGHKKGDIVEKYNENRVLCWSKWNDNDYKKFNESIKKFTQPGYKSKIEWEMSKWIEISKNRNIEKT